MSPRSRLESFRAEQAKRGGAPPTAEEAASRIDVLRTQQSRPGAASTSDGFRINLPNGGSGSSGDLGEPSIPALGLGSMSAQNVGGGPLSSRRLKKEVLKADSKNAEASNAAGSITLRDELGTPRSVRVVQSEESEGLYADTRRLDPALPRTACTRTVGSPLSAPAERLAAVRPSAATWST